MALKATLQALDEVSDDQKTMYAETKIGDKTVYMLDVEDIDNHPKVRGVITANNENKRKRDEYKSKVDELEARFQACLKISMPDEWQRLKSGEKPDEQLQALKDQHTRAVEALKQKHRKTWLLAINRSRNVTVISTPGPRPGRPQGRAA